MMTIAEMVKYLGIKLRWKNVDKRAWEEYKHLYKPQYKLTILIDLLSTILIILILLSIWG